MWYWNPAFAVLLRTARNYPRIARCVLNGCRVSAYTKPTAPPSPLPKDQGDHDPDIDLITLRRRPASTNTAQEPQKTEPERPLPFRIPIVDVSEEQSKVKDEAIAPKLPPRPKAEPIQQDPQPAALETQGQLTNEPSIAPSSTPTFPPKARESPEAEKPRADAPSSANLDPQLVEYLKSLKPPKVFSANPKRPTQEPIRPSPEDADIDLLRPHDIRANYATAGKSKQYKHTGNNAQGSGPLSRQSGVVGDVPEHEADTRIQRLGLKREGDRVVIPRPILRKLIEDTITLSGASIQGEDVIIQRYSPTWHRFARLLRTSDLHKISSSRSSGPPSIPPETKRNEIQKELLKETKLEHTSKENEIERAPAVGKTEQVPREVKLEHLRKESNTEALENVATVPEQPVSEITPKSNPHLEKDREYTVLSLNSRKRKVIVSRFRKLLDLAPDSLFKSSEDLLKVEYLDRYSLIR